MKTLPISLSSSMKLPDGSTLNRMKNGTSTITTPEGLTKVYDKAGKLVLQTVIEGGKKVIKDAGQLLNQLA